MATTEALSETCLEPQVSGLEALSKQLVRLVCRPPMRLTAVEIKGTQSFIQKKSHNVELVRQKNQAG